MRSKAPIDNRPSWQQQRALRNLLYNLMYELDHYQYEPLSNARYDESNQLSGDASIIIVDKKTEKAVVAIQIIHSRVYKETQTQVMRDLGDFPYLKEIFIYQYETEDWYRFMRQTLEEAEDEWENYRNSDDYEYNPDSDDERDHPSYSYALRRVMDDFARIDI